MKAYHLIIIDQELIWNYFCDQKRLIKYIGIDYVNHSFLYSGLMIHDSLDWGRSHWVLHGCSMEVKTHGSWGNEKPCTLGFTWCNPTCDTLYKEPHMEQNRQLRHKKRGLAEFVNKCTSLKLF